MRTPKLPLATRALGPAALGLVALGLLVLAPTAGAAGVQAPIPRGPILANELKKSMQATYKQSVPGIVFSRVTCTLGEQSATGKCHAKFVVRKRQLKGTFKVTAKVDDQGGVRWQATSVSCASMKTGKRVAC